MSNGGRGVGGERGEGRNGNGEREGEEKGCVMTTMKCRKKWKRAEKNINLSGLLLNAVLLDQKKKKSDDRATDSTGVISVCFLSGKKAFPEFSTDIRSDQ